MIKIPINFNVKEARDQLLNQGIAITLRSNIIKDGYHALMIGNRFSKTYNRIGFVKVTLIQEITNPKQLTNYVKQSGFKNIKTWISKAKKSSKYLYRVELIK